MKLMTLRGFSLVEALISLLLIAFILLGLDAMQVYSLKQLKAAYFYSIAVNQVINLSERMTALPTTTNVSDQVHLWNQENQTVLPNGFGTVTKNFSNETITIYWGKRSHECVKNIVGESGCLTEKIWVE